jgi:hypothetical protein
MRRRPLSRPQSAALAGLALLYGAVGGTLWLGWKQWEARRRQVQVYAEQHSVFHYDFAELRVRTRDEDMDASFGAEPPRLAVTRGGDVVPTIGGVREMTLKRYAPGVWGAKWPVPWNAPAGEYRPVLLGRDALGERVKVSPFRVARRRPLVSPKGLVVATLERNEPFAEMRVKGPDGAMTDWRGLLDWAQHLGADAFWMSGASTPGQEPGQTWLAPNRELIPGVAAECRRRGLKFGVYVLYSLTLDSKNKVPGYEYALEIEGGKPVETRAISIRERRRLEDAVEFLRPIAADPNVDMVGLDYIRNALGGVELVDDFVAEMPNLALPAEWNGLSKTERMLWLARKKAMRKDMALIDAWQWWRARRVALIVKEVKARLGNKPLWAFTLTWDKGWHHGQDPVMMSDAGVDLDALMFYEADKAQYAQMLRDWNAYVRKGDVNLVPGNIFDWNLHQKDASGPAEFGRRLDAALDRVYADGPAQGVFYHDLGRLLWSTRLGKWGTKGWAEEARRVSRKVKMNAQP